MMPGARPVRREIAMRMGQGTSSVRFVDANLGFGAKYCDNDETEMNRKPNGRSASEELTFSQRLEIIVSIFKNQPLQPILDKLSPLQLVQAHNFLWDKMVEFHVKTQQREFRREEVTKKMMPSAKYQRQQNCDLRLDYCKGVECIWSNPVCAGNKVKMNMEVMAAHIRSFLSGVSPTPAPHENYVTL